MYHSSCCSVCCILYMYTTSDRWYYTCCLHIFLYIVCFFLYEAQFPVIYCTASIEHGMHLHIYYRITARTPGFYSSPGFFTDKYHIREHVYSIGSYHCQSQHCYNQSANRQGVCPCRNALFSAPLIVSHQHLLKKLLQMSWDYPDENVVAEIL